MTNYVDVVEPSELEHCDCPMVGESDGGLERCHADGPRGVLCSRPDGHDGPHAACTPASHPGTAWRDRAPPIYQAPECPDCGAAELDKRPYSVHCGRCGWSETVGTGVGPFRPVDGGEIDG